MSRGEQLKKNSGRNIKSKPAFSVKAPISKVALAPILEKLTELSVSYLEKQNLELVSLECPLEGGRRVIRFTIDHLAKPDKGSSVTVGECAVLSRQLARLLEEIYPEDGSEYVLEVSSPGLDRALFNENDFIRFSGSLVRMKISEDDRQIRLKGRLLTEDKPWRILTENGEIPFELSQVISARLTPELKP